MIDFLQSNWKDILEIVISLIVGFLGGIKYSSIRNKNKSRITGNNNLVIQKGNEYNGQNK